MNLNNMCKCKIDKIVASMAVPFRCGGSVYINNELIYKTGDHFVSGLTMQQEPCKTIKWWENWYQTHDHSYCVKIANELAKQKSK